MKIAKSILIIILAAVVCFLLFRNCGNHPDSTPSHSDTIRDTIPGDSVPYEVQIPVPYPVYQYHDTGSWHYYPIDTPAAVSDWLLFRVYNDTLKDDTSAMVALIDTCYQNRLRQRKLIFQNRRPIAVTTIINNYGEKPHNALYFGGEAGIGLNGGFTLTPKAEFVEKRGNAFTLGYEMTTVNNPAVIDFVKRGFIEVGYLRKLSFRRAGK